MKCPKCGGSGTTVGHTFYCYQCGYTAKVRTNFERITESPETLAEFISEAEWFAERCAEQLLNCETCQCKWCGLAGKLNLIDWLKREELE